MGLKDKDFQDIFDYIAQGANVADLKAAGYDLKDLVSAGIIEASDTSDPLSSDKSTTYSFPKQPRQTDWSGQPVFEQPQPSMRNAIQSGTASLAEFLGVEEKTANRIGRRVAGTDGSAFSPADLVPGVALQEGAQQTRRGLETGNYVEAGLGALNMGLGVAEVGALGKILPKPKYDPTVARTFFGPESSKANLSELANAKEMETNGFNSKEIWMRTGWWNSPKQGWRFEVSDDTMEVARVGQSERLTNEEAIEHPEFFKALDPKNPYSFIDVLARDVREGPFSGDPGYGNYGAYNSGNKSVSVNPTLLKQDLRSTAAHELQHAEQDIFDRAGKGMSPDRVKSDFAMVLDTFNSDQRRYVQNLVRLGRAKAEVEEISAETDWQRQLLKGPWNKGQPKFVESTQAFINELEETLSKSTRLVNDLTMDEQVSRKYAPEFTSVAEDFENLGRAIAHVNPNIADNQLFTSPRYLSDEAATALYRLEAGEVEARLVGRRVDLDSSERSLNFPEDDPEFKSDDEFRYTVKELYNWYDDLKKRVRPSNRKN